MNRRSLFRNMAAASAGLALAPRLVDWDAPAAASTAASSSSSAYPLLPFIDYYQTNISTNLSFATNAAAEIQSGFWKLWQTGTEWDNGVVLDAEALHANMLHSVWVTRRRTEAQAKQAYIVDRQNHSYYMIAGLGPLASYGYAGSEATTTITSAPDGVQDPIDSDNGNDSGLTASPLGALVTLVNTVRGNYSSGNPSKYTFMYPRPWRMNNDSVVIDTGAVDEYGYPVYESDVIVEPQLLLARSTTPSTDDAYPSGHMNALMLAGLAYAYAVPERFQELFTRAMEGGNYRIVAGMHSSVDVVGARILAIALAAAILSDPANAEIKAAGRANALAYFTAETGTSDLFAFAHSENLAEDPYASRSLNERTIAPYWTYVLPVRGPVGAPMVVPLGAEVLLETRQPYLSASQRREVLRTTALPSGYALINEPELWGRLNLFAAADGYGAFDSPVTVVMDGSLGGFSASDAWKNDIRGIGGLDLQGSGTLTLTGANSFEGGTVITGGTLVAASASALGPGPVQVGAAGTLAVAAGSGDSGSCWDDGGAVRVGGPLSLAGTLSVTLDVPADGPVLSADGDVQLDGTSSLEVALSGTVANGTVIPVLSARRVTGTFGSVSVTTSGYSAVAVHDRDGVSVQISGL